MDIRVTDDIHLTEIRPVDKSTIVEYLNNREIYDWTLRVPHPYTDIDFEAFQETVADATKQHGEPIHWAVREGSGQVIGGVGFDGLSKGHSAEIGYWLARPFWGRGIMTAVVGAACNYGLQHWDLVRISAHVFEGNQASARVLEKNGFEFEGRLRRFRKKDGRFIDVLLYALLPNGE